MIAAITLPCGLASGLAPAASVLLGAPLSLAAAELPDAPDSLALEAELAGGSAEVAPFSPAPCDPWRCRCRRSAGAAAFAAAPWLAAAFGRAAAPAWR